MKSRGALAVAGGSGSAAGYGLVKALRGEETSMQGYVAAFSGGAVSGAIGGIAGPAGGSVSKYFGQPAVSCVASCTKHALNFWGGVQGNALTTMINGEELNAKNLLISGTVNVVANKLADTIAPGQRHVTTIPQAGVASIRTITGLVSGSINSELLNRSLGVGFVFGVTSEVVSDPLMEP